MPKKFNKEEFIKKAKVKHGDKYDYSRVEYINSHTKICIICSKHGEFWQRPSDHLRGCGCPGCSGTKHSNTEEFIKKCEEKYGNKFDYSKVNYVNNKTKVEIVCHNKNILNEEHGSFWQRPNDHLTGYGCPKCAGNIPHKINEWIEKAKLVHGCRYDYSKVNYIDSNTKVCIICSEHGEFWQDPNNHLNGADCPQCNLKNKSKMEEQVSDMFKEHSIIFERQKTFEWLKYKRHLYIDFYIPKYNIAVEVMGDQHYRPISRFGGEKCFEMQKKRDRLKKILCQKHGIKIFYINKKNYNISQILSYITNGKTA